MSKMIKILMNRRVIERRSSNSAKGRQQSTFRLQNAVRVLQNAVRVHQTLPFFRRFGSDGRSSVLNDGQTSRQKHWRRTFERFLTNERHLDDPGIGANDLEFRLPRRGRCAASSPI